MKLKTLKIQNFKNIKDISIDFFDDNTHIFGRNETGKTTIVDAMSWLLFDKDSRDQSPEAGFEIKPRETDRSVKHGLETSVEAVFEINNISYTFKKVFAENWIKPRGQLEKEFKGHETTFFIDEVPLKKKDFNTRIIELIADPEKIKLLSSITYFNEILHWKKRREILLELAGDITDEDVFESNINLVELKKELGNRKIDDLRAIAQEARKRLNKDLEMIPVRIQEVEKGMPDLTQLDKKGLKKEIENLVIDIDIIEDEKRNLLNGSEVSEKQKKKAELETAKIKLENEIRRKAEETGAEERKMLREAEDELHKSRYAQSSLLQKKNTVEENIKEDEAFLASLRKDFVAINERVLQFRHDSTCPTCGQAIPESQIEQAHKKAQEEFNLDKSSKLSAFNEQGKKRKAHKESLEKNLAEVNKQIDEIATVIAKKTAEVDNLRKKVSSINATPDFDIPELKKINTEISDINSDIEKIKTEFAEYVAKLNASIADKKSAKKEAESKLGLFEQAERATKRLDKLTEERRSLSEKIEHNEKILFLLDSFTVEKVNLLETQINSKFDNTIFTLFEKQVNGGISEVCYATYKGVRYDSMNNGARINCSLDVIETLSKHYGISVPVFVDNAESVTGLKSIDGQVISLFVDEKYDKLTVEKGE